MMTAMKLVGIVVLGLLAVLCSSSDVSSKTHDDHHQFSTYLRQRSNNDESHPSTATTATLNNQHYQQQQQQQQQRERQEEEEERALLSLRHGRRRDLVTFDIVAFEDTDEQEQESIRDVLMEKLPYVTLDKIPENNNDVLSVLVPSAATASESVETTTTTAPISPPPEPTITPPDPTSTTTSAPTNNTLPEEEESVVEVHIDIIIDEEEGEEVELEEGRTEDSMTILANADNSSSSGISSNYYRNITSDAVTSDVPTSTYTSASGLDYIATDATTAPELTPIENNSPNQLTFGDVKYVGNDHDGFFYAPWPLGVCQGDCDTDDDCREGLYCHQRTGLQPVPYCSLGDMRTTADFCTWNDTSSYPPPSIPKPPIGSFRIKLYWEEGYLWQNETYDRQWCMISGYDGYPGNGECHYGDFTLPCNPDQIYIGKCLDDDPRQWFTLLDLGATYTNSADHREVLIGTVDPEDVFAEPKRCLMRQSSEIYLSHQCDPADPRQRFFALSGSFTPGRGSGRSRFEISQYQGYTTENCITNAHHPKSGEVVEFHVCNDARGSEDQTSYWQLLNHSNK